MCIQRMGFCGLLTLGFGVCVEIWMSGGLCLVTLTTIALRFYCICGSICDMAVTSLTYPSALSFLMAVLVCVSCW